MCLDEELLRGNKILEVIQIFQCKFVWIINSEEFMMYFC